VADIRQFTVRVIERNLALPQGCASSPTMFHDAQVTSRIKDAFASIAGSLSGARLSRSLFSIRSRQRGSACCPDS
jgi:hypothetical protein